uniref:Reverse transcriptase domain-containing protein n=1 Tax=Tanacetum cinerariifolium TaxID=118510 RepID=A0A699IQ83_TANCI|nr:hypothetical protein [Tanacetum cinerariifolium]
MVPNTEKLMEVFIEGLSQCIEGTVTASKPQTLEEAINIAQRLMDQIIKHGSRQRTRDHKRKFDDKRNSNNNDNYPNNRVNNYQLNHNNNSNSNNDYRHQQNRRQETFRSYDATLIENSGSIDWCPRVDCMRWRLALKGVWRCRVVRGIQGGDEVIWLALELKGGDGDACGLL